MIYALGVRGRELLDELDQVERDGKRDWRLENNRLKLNFLEHETLVTEAVIAFQMAAADRGWQFRWWKDPTYHSDGTLPRRIVIAPEHGRHDSLPFRPDAYLEIDRDDGHRLNFFLEIDRGTEPQVSTNFRRSSIAQKLLAYWNHITAAARQHGTRNQTWRAIFITTTKERIDNMRRRVVQELVDPKRKGTHSFLFTTLDRCRIDPDEPYLLFEDLRWWSSKIGYDNPRRFFLDTCPECHQAVDVGNENYRVLNSRPAGLVAGAGTTLLPDHLPDDEEPLYAHLECPGLRT